MSQHTQQHGLYHSLDERKRWRALIVLCLGVLMIALDTTIVNVALPSIRTDFEIIGPSLVWVVNAYILTFAGFLLLGGRLGDVYGHRRLFLLGLALFTVASLACGLSNTQGLLIAARAVQGLGGAILTSVSLSLIMNLFTGDTERAKAMGVYSFVSVGGGSLGVLLGGVLTTLHWRWIFLVNIPIGVLVYALCKMFIPSWRGLAGTKLDLTGAVTITVSLMLAVYAIVDGNEVGWTSTQTLGLLGAAVVLLIVFLVVESRVAAPLVPLGLFRLRNLAVSNIVGVLWAAGNFAWFFMSALYMQLVLGYDPMQVGLAFMPAHIMIMAFSLGLSAKIVGWFGIRGPMAVGLILAAVGLGLLALAPEKSNAWLYVMPAMVLLGIGQGIAFNPILLAAMGDVKPSDSGVASGIVNTAFMMGGALGLAILASFAAARTEALTAAGASSITALNGGYHLAFLLGALCVIVAAVLGSLFIRSPRQPAESVERAASMLEGV